ncbi:MAG: aldose 1-epimerase [Spirochaetes bacterium]|nr:aldose 1-epimerase [Spirochaetota bacterium]
MRSHTDKNGLLHIILEHSETGAEADIIPELGGMVHRINLPAGINLSVGTRLSAEKNLPAERENRICLSILKSDSDEEILLNPLFRGRILFPFNDRIPGGKYRFNGREYSFPVNDKVYNDAVHGFLYKKVLKPVSTVTQKYEELTLFYETRDEPGYPFLVSIRISYKIDEDSFTLALEITNQGDCKAPAAFGWHPYFSLPGASPGSLFLQISARRYLEVDEKLLPTGRYLPVQGSPYDFRKPSPINGREIDIGYLLDEKRCTLTDMDSGLSVLLNMEGEIFSFLQVFAPGKCDFIALEPVSSLTDAFNRKELGLIVLEPGERLKGKVTVKLCIAGTEYISFIPA